MRNITAKEVVQKFYQLIISRHGCPERLLSDNGRQFTSQAVDALCKQYRIVRENSVPYHPQGNGKVEKFVGFLSNTIKGQIKSDQSNWDQLLDTALFTYRISLNRTLKENPFYLIYGRDPLLPQDLILPVSEKSRREITNEDIFEYKSRQLKALKQDYFKLNEHKAEQRIKVKDYYDKSHNDIVLLVEDLVMVYIPRTKVGFSTKFLPHWTGPYRITKQITRVTFRVENLNGTKSHAVHVQHLKLFRPWNRESSEETSNPDCHGCINGRI